MRLVPRDEFRPMANEFSSCARESAGGASSIAAHAWHRFGCTILSHKSTSGWLIKRRRADRRCGSVDGSGFYFVGDETGSFNLWSYDFDSEVSKQLTQFSDDSVVMPAISHGR